MGGLDSDCTVVTLHRTANFRVKHFNSDIEQARRGILLLIILFIQPILLLLYRFLVKNPVSGPVFRVKIAKFDPPTIAIFEISIFFETQKSAKLVSYIVTVLL